MQLVDDENDEEERIYPEFELMAKSSTVGILDLLSLTEDEFNTPEFQHTIASALVDAGMVPDEHGFKNTNEILGETPKGTLTGIEGGFTGQLSRPPRDEDSEDDGESSDPDDYDEEDDDPDDDAAADEDDF